MPYSSSSKANDSCFPLLGTLHLSRLAAAVTTVFDAFCAAAVTSSRLALLVLGQFAGASIDASVWS